VNALLGVGDSKGYATVRNDLFCDGQAGVQGVAVDPNFASNRFVYVYASSKGPNRTYGGFNNIVMRMRVDAPLAAVSDISEIINDIGYKPAKSAHPFGGPGAHNGGRIRFNPGDGFLYVLTGDNHSGAGPQHPTQIIGKVLRVDRDGKAAPGNGAPAGFDARIYTYGHRNVQGIAFRPVGQPNAGQAYTSEHGPNHSDELTALVPGGNGGWDPQNRPDLKCSDGYCGYSGNPFTMPMTDTQRFPKAMLPAWNNEQRSQGMGPLAFLEGAQWKGWNGKLAVALMRDQRLDIVALDAQGKAAKVETADLPKLRLRSVVPGPDGALWGSTDDGQILKISPK
jgi:glucose/arabinose dehydrogenase